MSQPMSTFIVANALRFLMVLVYLCIGVAALTRRGQLGVATTPAALGSGLLALANVLSLITYYWQLTAARSGREALRHLASVLGLSSYVGQSLAVIGAAALGYAVFSGRPAIRNLMTSADDTDVSAGSRRAN